MNVEKQSTIGQHPQPALRIRRWAPLYLCIAVTTLIFLLVYLSPSAAVLLGGAITGIAVFILHCLTQRIVQEHVQWLSLAIVLLPGLYLAKDQSWGVAGYFSMHVTLLAGLHCIALAFQKARR